MSKAVMISIRPKWCEKICGGEKAIEVRKTRPKLAAPFKCYIYETQGRTDTPWVDEDGHMIFVGRGQVIGEFTCDEITRVNISGFWDEDGRQLENRIADTCLTPMALCEYAGERVCYGWHISDLKIYDTPKELSKFSRPFENCIDKVCDEFGCASCENGGHIKRPPQSWCYVEQEG